MKQDSMKHEQDNDQAPKEMTTPILHSRKNSAKRITTTHRDVVGKATDEKNKRRGGNGVRKVSDRDEAKSPCSSPAGPSGDLYLQEDGLVKQKVLPSITGVTKRRSMSQEVVMPKSKSKNTLVIQDRPPFVVGKHKICTLLPITTKCSVNRTSSTFVPMVNNKFHQHCFKDNQIKDSLTKSTTSRARKNAETVKKILKISVDKTIRRERIQEEQVLNAATKPEKNYTRYDNIVSYTQNTKNMDTVLPEEHMEVYTKNENIMPVSNFIIKDDTAEDVQIFQEEHDPGCENVDHSEHENYHIKSEITEQNVPQMSVVDTEKGEIRLEDNWTRDNHVVCQYEIVNRKCKDDINVQFPYDDVVDIEYPTAVREGQKDEDTISEMLTLNIDCYKIQDKNDLNTDIIPTNVAESARVEELDTHLQIDEFTIHDGESANEKNDASHEDKCETLMTECNTMTKTINNSDLEKNIFKTGVNFDETRAHQKSISTVITTDLLSLNSLSKHESKLCDSPDDTRVKSTHSFEQELSTEDNKERIVILNNKKEVCKGCSDEQRDESDGEDADILQKFVINPHPLSNLRNNTAFDHAIGKLLTLEYYGELLARLAKNSQARLVESLEHVCQNDKVHNAALRSEASVQLDQALDSFIGEFSSTLMSYYNVSAAEANACTFFEWFSRAESEIAADLTEAGDANDNL